MELIEAKIDNFYQIKIPVKGDQKCYGNKNNMNSKYVFRIENIQFNLITLSDSLH